MAPAARRAENDDAFFAEHRQRRPQQHAQEQQGPQAELEGRAGRRWNGVGFCFAHIARAQACGVTEDLTLSAPLYRTS